MIRTGIDLGTTSVKLVRGQGAPRLERITHLGYAEWGPREVGDDVVRAADALRRLLRESGLRPRHLGHVAVAARGDEASLREVRLPVLTSEELKAALAYEARKHLDLEGIEAPYLAAQILGAAEAETEVAGTEGTSQMRALLVAIPESQRTFPLRVLARVGLEPEVVDLEPLANLNALLGRTDDAQRGVVLGLLDVGARRSVLQLTGPQGGFLSRVVAEGMPRAESGGIAAGFASKLTQGVRETLVHYRGRYRQEAERIYVSGVPDLCRSIADALRSALEIPIGPFDPIGDLAAGLRSGKIGPSDRVRFVTACGLCRWWDADDV